MLALGGLALAGCDGSATGPEPRPELVPFLYACNTWTPPIDPSTVVLADLRLNPDASTSAALAAIRRAGGDVVRRFNVQVLRVAIRAGEIPAVPGVGSARGVTDAGTAEVRVFVVYSRAPTEADVQALQARGGRDANLLALSRLIAVTVPDAAIPPIERLSGVSHVEADGVGCAG